MKTINYQRNEQPIAAMAEILGLKDLVNQDGSAGYNPMLAYLQLNKASMLFPVGLRKKSSIVAISAAPGGTSPLPLQM
jgi:hypothetical protein